MGRTLPCEPCQGTGLFRAKNEPPDDCMTCGGTGWVSARTHSPDLSAPHLCQCDDCQRIYREHLARKAGRSLPPRITYEAWAERMRSDVPTLTDEQLRTLWADITEAGEALHKTTPARGDSHG